MVRLLTPPPGPPDTELVDLMEAARRIGITYDGVRRRIRRGRLHGVKQDGRWFVAMSAHAGPAPDTAGHPSAETGEATGQPPDSAGPLRDLLLQVEGERDHLRQVVTAQQQTIDRLTVLLKQAQDHPALPAAMQPEPPPDTRRSVPETAEKPPCRRPWWRRWFGG